MSREIFTIGHSNHLFPEFLKLLQKYDISAVCDVRSTPYSSRNPQFNRELLQEELPENNIAYIYLGQELGARPKDPACYKYGRVQYSQVALAPAFQQGLVRVRKGIQNHRIALMCAEKDPITCHRTILVCRNLKAPDISIQHILYDGELESLKNSEQRLQKLLGLEQGELFQNSFDPTEKAYDIQSQQIAYEKPPAAISPEL